MTMPTSQKKRDGGHIGGSVEIPNDIRVRMVWLDTVSTRNMYSFIDAQVAPTFALTPAIVSAVQASLVASYNANIASFQPTSISFFGCDMRDIRPPGNNSIVTAVPATGTSGTSASPLLPHGVAAVLTKRTARAGQAFRGRMYLPGWAQNADTGDGVITATLVTALGVFASGILSALSGQSMIPALAQPARNQYAGITGTVHPARPAGVVPLTSLTLRNNAWDSQRRRGSPS